jgi:hypothetical protein
MLIQVSFVNKFFGVDVMKYVVLEKKSMEGQEALFLTIADLVR